MDRLHQYTLYEKTSYETVLSQQRFSWRCFSNAHQYYVMFLLTQFVAFVFASYRTQKPFDFDIQMTVHRDMFL